MMKIQTEGGYVEIPVEICQISDTLKQMYDEVDGDTIDLSEIGSDLMDSIIEFYHVYSALEDSTKTKFDDSITVPDCELKTHYASVSDEKLIATLDISQYLKINPFTNLLASVLANKIQQNHKF